MTPKQSQALEAARGQAATPKNIARVAKEAGDEPARWAFTQWALRERAKAKFALADRMLFDRDGLEMATHERVAAYHASHYPHGETVADLACGIGGDLVALARRGPVVAYEQDPARAECARHNLAAHGLEAEVITGQADLGAIKDVHVFLDPQRRRSKGDYGAPDPRSLRVDAGKVVGVKLGTEHEVGQVQRDLFPCVEAVSFGGECRELLAWSHKERGVCAVHVESGERFAGATSPPCSDRPAALLFHADPAAIKARALGTLCARFGLVALGDSDGYLTGGSGPKSPWLRAYRVVWHGPADKRQTQAALASLGATVAEVKTRGTAEPADKIRAQFKPAGLRRLALAVWPVGKSLRHTLVECITREL